MVDKSLGGGKEQTRKGHKEIWGVDENIININCSDDYTTIYICQNASDYTN